MMDAPETTLIGANGQLGNEWLRFLQSEKIPFTSYNSKELDITCFEDVRSVLDRDKPRFVINASAYTKVDLAEKERERAFAVNAGAVANLARLCAERDIRLVHYSTDYVFAGRATDRQCYPEGYPEHARAEPVNTYGCSKWEGEKSIRDAGDNHLIIRVAWLCGAWGGNFVKTMLRLGKENRELRVVDDQVGSPSFTPNVVFNSWQLIRKERTGTWHITSEGMLSWFEFAREIFRVRNMDVSLIPIPAENFPTPAERPFFSKLSTEKLKTIKEAVTEDWREGLRNLLNQLD